MRVLFSLIALFALLFTLAAASSNNPEDGATRTISVFRPWTWSAFSLSALTAQPDAVAQHYFTNHILTTMIRLLILSPSRNTDLICLYLGLLMANFYETL
ncbi:hypothetical protein DFH08DRAFT_1079133 [Mycena albidolilacea]|uniref:Uncharacterized protein n=1 Tax=Mycena albidolilacea TaxID=1033008 RepID=A0AAD7EUX2_9AGAR|nr:hypothetical protein DFH08DRAFT_1079133 [Mycena albidolilacea]